MPDQLKIIAGTGHRPDKIFSRGYRTMDSEFPGLVKLCEFILTEQQPDEVIEGHAQGFDQALGQASINLGIKLTVALPYADFGDNWPVSAQRYAAELCSKANRVVCVDEQPGYKAVDVVGYHVAKLDKRNHWMTDHCTEMAALWNGTPGGTRNNVRYAERKGVPITNYWEKWITSDAGLRFYAVSS